MQVVSLCQMQVWCELLPHIAALYLAASFRQMRVWPEPLLYDTLTKAVACLSAAHAVHLATNSFAACLQTFSAYLLAVKQYRAGRKEPGSMCLRLQHAQVEKGIFLAHQGMKMCRKDSKKVRFFLKKLLLICKHYKVFGK